MFVQIEALELLVNKGADISIIDNEGLTPLDVAKENQQDECVEMLFKITQPVFTVRTPVSPIAVTIPYLRCHPHLMKKTIARRLTRRMQW